MEILYENPWISAFSLALLLLLAGFSWPGLFGPAITVRLLAKFGVHWYRVVPREAVGLLGKWRKRWKVIYTKNRSRNGY